MGTVFSRPSENKFACDKSYTSLMLSVCFSYFYVLYKSGEEVNHRIQKERASFVLESLQTATQTSFPHSFKEPKWWVKSLVCWVSVIWSVSCCLWCDCDLWPILKTTAMCQRYRERVQGNTQQTTIKLETKLCVQRRTPT